jgi:glycosyltransferase involved in cell wall biosynthesis
MASRYAESMMHLFVNALAASAGGGLTYVRNVLPRLAAAQGLRVTIALAAGLREEFGACGNTDFIELDLPTARRFRYEQSELPKLIKRCGADVLLSTGNFAIRKSPVPQILLSRNSIYTSPDYYRDLLARHEYRMWFETRLRSVLARRSISRADLTVAPSEAFATELMQWSGVQVIAVHHGFDWELFVKDSRPLSPEVEASLQRAAGSLKLLFVSHYNYYRNFETLIRSLPLLRDRLADRPVKLLLTCHLVSGKNPGAYRPEAAANLIKSLGVSDMIVELGTIPYRQLHHLYASADVYVTPAYTETFAHPLVEAMASGLPVVASDLPVHREICGPAALYFERFSAGGLAARIVECAQSAEMRSRMAAAGLERSRDFSWKTHVDAMLGLCHGLIKSNRALAQT